MLVRFEPAPPAGVLPPSGVTALSDFAGVASFDALVFWGLRGANFTMVVAMETLEHSAGVNELRATVCVEPCDANEFVVNYTDCAPCPTGAVCNGTAVLSAQPNYWRTGHYDADGAYAPNTKEQRFLRCSTSACEGGPESGCASGTGPVCGTCVGRETFNYALLRCEDCSLPTAVYLCIYVAYLLLQMLILQVCRTVAARPSPQGMGWGGGVRLRGGRGWGVLPGGSTGKSGYWRLEKWMSGKCRRLQNDLRAVGGS